VVATIRKPWPIIVDLGVGTGALAERCLAALPRAKIIGIDSDPDILAAARRRLARHDGRLELKRGDFLRTPIPKCDAIVATLALHHIRSSEVKQRFYRRCRLALRRHGVLASGDVFLADDPTLRKQHFSRWRNHMERVYGPRAARRFLSMWAGEDRYFPLSTELTFLRRAGLRPDVIWRRPPFGVIVGRRAR
jgi:trans-aconitate methyltransferase